MAKTKDDPVDDLYGAPLEEFVARRDALAKALKADGDKERAAAVKKLPKPTRAAWAVNRLVRDKPAEIRALLDAGAALEGAQQELLGGADRAVLRGAADAARRLVEALAAEADADGATQDKVRATLHAATVDGGVRAEVAEGRVVKERAAAGFGGLDGIELPAGAGAPASRSKTTKKSSKAAGQKREAAAPARAPAAPEPPPPPPKPKGPTKAQRDALRRANEAEARAERAVDGARRALEQVEKTIAARRRELEEAETSLSEAQARRERAEQAAAPRE
jgi:hypothetical protein